MSDIYLSIVIPAFNEERRLLKTLDDVDEYFRKQDYSYEIIVVNDGSSDKTCNIVKNFYSKTKNLRLIDNKINRGKGYAVRQGLMSARGKYCLFTDADNSTPINQVENVLSELNDGYDIVIGSRDIDGSILDPPQHWIRGIVLGDGFRLFRKIIIGLWKIEDTQCGFKIFNKEVIQNVIPKCFIDRFAFDSEILALADKMGYSIKEVPVTWRNNVESKVGIKSVVRMAIDLIKIRLNFIFDKYGVRRQT